MSDDDCISSNTDGPYLNKRPFGFLFLGTPYFTRSWRDLIIQFITLVYSDKPDLFESITPFHGNRRPYFSRKESELADGRPVGASGWYVETNLSGNNAKEFVDRVYQRMGYGPRLRLDCDSNGDFLD